jgi:ribosomal protein S18 acetylase RimI-like enzyme
MASATERAVSQRRASVRAQRVRFRRRPRATDVDAIRKLAAAVGVFHAEEQSIAVELIEERLAQGPASGYHFVFAERAGQLVGYCAYGSIPLTRASYDLYWIVVDPAMQGMGVGRELLLLTERAVHEQEGQWLYIETSSRRPYARTRRFYERAGYREAARLRHFYAQNDHKVVFCKRIK